MVIVPSMWICFWLVIIRFRLFLAGLHKWCYVLTSASFHKAHDVIFPFIGDVNLGYLIMVVLLY